MKILVSGSLAYDRIMDFPGKFSDHILPDKIHILNVCFMINGLKENFGGTAGNIAYTLALLEETPTIVATAGRDFPPYAEWLKSNGIAVDHVKIIVDELTAGAYITTDQSDNQITAFNPGAMKFTSDPDFDALNPADTLAIVAPGNLDDMYGFIQAYKKHGIPYIFDPGQSLPQWNGQQLTEMISGAKIFISNDYELELTLEKTSATLEDLTSMADMVITTKAEFGSQITSKQIGTISIPAVPVTTVKDPTGAGDSFRGGLIKGLVVNPYDPVHAMQMGSGAASFSVEVYGTQNFHFTQESFNARFKGAFGKIAY
ncbi:MAG: carbohydrate kinase family protein [Nitrospirae bacterium]|nr:carbohydrate kinase family protein [Nitrospirota bacterium]